MPPTAWHSTEDLDEFLARTGDFLRSRPDLHTVVLTVTEGLRTRWLHAYGDEARLSGPLEEDGSVRGAYSRTPPYRLYLTPLTPARADSLAAPDRKSTRLNCSHTHISPLPASPS